MCAGERLLPVEPEWLLLAAVTVEHTKDKNVIFTWEMWSYEGMLYKFSDASMKIFYANRDALESRFTELKNTDLAAVFLDSTVRAQI